MSIKKALICTIPEVSDDTSDAMTLRTTDSNSILVDILVDVKRFVINIDDLTIALQELNEFNIGNIDEGHISMNINEIEHIPELEIMALDNIPEKVVDTDTKI